MVWYALVSTFLCTLFLPLLLFLTAVKLWEMYVNSGRDHSCGSPLPPGTMGLPFLGETLQMVLQRKKFLRMKRQKYGYIYKTHLFGSPTVRVMGAENVRRILLAEHRLVAVKWPVSVRTILGSDALSNVHGPQHRNKRKTIMKAFSHEALEYYIPVVQEEVRRALRRWMRGGSCVLVYAETRRLMFRIAMRVLLGFEPEQIRRDEHELVDAFEEMIKNLFSLPIDVPFSGLYRGLRARNFIHAKIEENIKKKLQQHADDDRKPKDALQLLIENSRRNEEGLRIQEVKEFATELLFGGHETTASAATSLVMFLGLHLDALRNVREELRQKVSNSSKFCRTVSPDLMMSLQPLFIESLRQKLPRYVTDLYRRWFLQEGHKELLGSYPEERTLTVRVLEQLKYCGCVVKETLRLNCPVPGGFRVALSTFELNGYQIPKGWNVIYSICDTHEVADVFFNKKEFLPERFMASAPEDSQRFNYIPFGGGPRRCVGKEFAKVLLKIFLVELATKCNWTLLNGAPTMKTGPTVYPVDNLPTKFSNYFDKEVIHTE